MYRIITIGFFFFSFLQTQAQPDRIEPPFWWAGMKNPRLQVMVHGDSISQMHVSVTPFSGVVFESVSKVTNPNYLFLNLKINSETKLEGFNILFTKGHKAVYTYRYKLKHREPGSAQRKGFNTSDVIYLIMPDRFANGDPSNDEVKGMTEGVLLIQ